MEQQLIIFKFYMVKHFKSIKTIDIDKKNQYLITQKKKSRENLGDNAKRL